MTFGSLFAGIGGFDLGLERAGMECRWQVEIDAYASSVLAKHWPGVTRWGDVRTFPVGDPAEWQVDLICAGVPCQPVSHAGKQKGANDDRWMWGEALRVVADLCPRFFVAENPIGLLNHDGGRTFHGILRAFASVGYVCEWHVIAAADVGAPHRRQRVWLVADANGRRRKRQRLKKHGDQQSTFGDIADRCGSWGRRAGQAASDSKYRGREGRYSERPWPDPAMSSGWWATEPSVGRVAHGVPSRVDRLRCLGNAVVPQVAEVIGRAIMAMETEVRA